MPWAEDGSASDSSRPKKKRMATETPVDVVNEINEINERLRQIAEELVAQPVTRDEYETNDFRLPDALSSAIRGRMDTAEAKDFMVCLMGGLREKHKVDVIRRLMGDLGFNLHLVSSGGMGEAIQEALAPIVAQTSSAVQPTKLARDPEASLVSKICAMMFPFIRHLPATNRATAMDPAKHESYKAATIMYKAESKQASDKFNEKLAERLKTVQSETLRPIRRAFFDSLIETIDDTFGTPSNAQHGAGAVKLKDVKAHLYPAWQKKIDDQGPGVFADKAFEAIRKHHPVATSNAEIEEKSDEDVDGGNKKGVEYHHMHEILGMGQPPLEFDKKVVYHLIHGTLEWCYETIDMDRKAHYDNNPPNSRDDSQGSASDLALDPAVQQKAHEEREADGFNAPRRVAQWAEKFKSPAVGGGGRGGGAGGSKVKKAKAGGSKGGAGGSSSHEDLKTNDHQRFNRKVMSLLGTLTKDLMKKGKITPETIKSRADAEALFRPYLPREAPAQNTETST